MNLQEVLQRIYDSELNVQISSFWDAGWEVAIGDTVNGFKIKFNVERVEDIAFALHEEMIRLYPDSDYAKGLV